MEELDFIIEASEESMINSISFLEKELLNIRAGKANPNMLSNVKVDYYGSQTLLNQIANINTPDSQTLSIQPWEKDKLEDIEKARFVNKVSNEEIIFHDFESNKAEAIISEVLANQTLIGLQAIGSKGPIICSGPFAKNKTFLGTIEKKWDYPVIAEDNHLGICRGIADLVTRK